MIIPRLQNGRGGFWGTKNSQNVDMVSEANQENVGLNFKFVKTNVVETYNFDAVCCNSNSFFKRQIALLKIIV